MKLTKRQMAILCAVVNEYSVTGEPVGSKTIAAAFEGQVSSATIRNEMSELCEEGFLEQPHTSAGRVPTSVGYRLYIDKMMPKTTLSAIQQKAIDDLLPKSSENPENMAKNAAVRLAELTNFASVSTISAGEGIIFIKAEVIPIGKSTFLVIAITSSGIIKNRACRTEFSVTNDMIITFHNLVDKFIINRPIIELSRAASQTLAACGGNYLLELTPLISTLFDIIIELSEDGVRLEGQTNLLSHKEYDGGRGKALLEFLKEQDKLLPILLGVSDNVHVMFGREMEITALSDTSMVIATYKIDGKPLGKVGIIGPTRMNYQQIIPCVTYFAEKLGLLLTDAAHDMEGER